MASFTDNSPAYLSQGSPLGDLNLYDRALSTKDQQYDKGVQRVQNAYDTVAGLDVMRGIDKQYLQSKLSQLQTNIQQLAGGDFSTNSLVTQAASLAPQISRDGNVQNAVLSTQQIRSLMNSQRLAKSKDPGNYGVALEWYDNKAVNDYLSNNDLGATYNGPSQATKIPDFDGDLQKELDKITPAKSIIRSADGKYQWKTQDFDVITNDRIQSTIDGFLATHPDAAKLSAIKGMYTYKDYDQHGLASLIQNNYEKNIGDLVKLNVQYKTQIENAPKDSYDFRQQRQKLIEANMQSILDMQGKINHNDPDKGLVRGSYIEALADPSNMDKMRQTLFVDNMKGMYTTMLQKNNITSETTSENYNATHSDENYWKAKANENQVANYNLEVHKAKESAAVHGFVYDQNGNLRSMQPGDAGYETYIRSTKKKADGSSIGDHSYQSSPIPGKVLNINTSQTEDKINKQIIGYGNVDKSARTDFENIWLSGHGGKTSEDFEKYMLDQSKLPLYSANDDYRAYQKQHSELSMNIATLNQLSLSAQSNAERLAPSGVDDNYRSALVNIWSNGGSDPMAYAPIAYDQSGNPITKITTALKSYEKNPEYNRIRNTVLDRSRFMDDASAASKSILDLNNKRLDLRNKYFQDHGVSFQPQENVYDEKQTDLSDVKNRVYSLISSNKYNSMNENSLYDGVNVDDIRVVGNQIDPVTGNVEYHAQWPDKKGKMTDIWIKDPQDRGESLPTYKPHVVAQRAIEILGKTPESGDGVLSSDNGLMKFQVRKRYPSGLECSVLLNGKPVETKPVASIDDAYNRVNSLATMPSINGGMMNEEEAAYRFATDDKRYRSKYQNSNK